MIPCKIWPWTLDKEGYAVMTVHYRQIRVARSVLEDAIGRALETGEVTRHMCHNKACVEATHLLPGTTYDNFLDNYKSGKTLKSQKLSDSDVLAIRALRGVKTNQEIAAIFGVGKTLVGDILTGKRKRHVGGDCG